MGVKEQGKLALMGCAGPMGIGAIDYAVNGPVSSKLIVVTDIDRAASGTCTYTDTGRSGKETGKNIDLYQYKGYRCCKRAAKA